MTGLNKSSLYNCYLCKHSLETPKTIFESSRQGVICNKCGNIFCTLCINERRDGTFYSKIDTRCPKCSTYVSPPMLIMYEDKQLKTETVKQDVFMDESMGETCCIKIKQKQNM